MGIEDLVCEEGEEGEEAEVSGPRAKEDDTPGFGGGQREGVQRFVCRQLKHLFL